LPQWAAEALALWVVHTYAFELRDVSTYVGVESPEKRCGKTTLLTVLSELVNRPVIAANISPPAFFRVIEEMRPTLLIDEADTFLESNDELRGILNSGYTRKTAYVVRVSGKAASPETAANENSASTDGAPGDRQTRLASFSCWCPKVMAAIGALPETLADRCILIKMQRKTAKENCERLRWLAPEHLRSQCARFVLDHADAIASARPELPEGLNDRAGDILEPLLALADLAGGPWPETARQAALALSAGPQECHPIGYLMLEIMIAFARFQRERLFSRELVRHLNSVEPDGWAVLKRRQHLNEQSLAAVLRPYGILPKTFWVGDECGRGYEQADLTGSYQRYIPKAVARARLEFEKQLYQARKLQEEKEKQENAKMDEAMAKLMSPAYAQLFRNQAKAV
jgi:hypothetical protein